MTKIIFMGTPDFSVPILKEVYKKYGVDLVITQPARPVGRKKVMTDPPVAVLAKLLGIEVYQPETMTTDEAYDKVKEVCPDLLITAAFGQILPKRVLDLAKLGAINVHASLLPKHRGGAPIHRALINGDDKTGVTIMYMEEKLDAGNIISSAEIEIKDEDNTGSLFTKLSQLGAKLLDETLPKIIAGKNDSIKQDDQEATFSPNISKSDEVIDFTLPVRDVFNHIRGLSPWPVGHTTVDGKRLKIFSAKLTDDKSEAAAGTIVGKTEDGFSVVTGDGYLINLTEVQLSGKKKSDAKNFISNNSHLIGERLGAHYDS